MIILLCGCLRKKSAFWSYDADCRMLKIVFKKEYVLGEQFLFGQHLIRTMDGEDAVQKGIDI